MFLLNYFLLSKRWTSVGAARIEVKTPPWEGSLRQCEAVCWPWRGSSWTHLCEWAELERIAWLAAQNIKKDNDRAYLCMNYKLIWHDLTIGLG